MPEITFRFTDATESGVDVGAGSLVRCSPANVRITSSGIRSTRAFTVPIEDGDASAVLTPGVWRIEVLDVEGYSERWVLVESDAADLPDLQVIDPATLEPLEPLPPSAADLIEQAQIILDASVVDGEVVDGDLVLRRQSGDEIEAGSVVGPRGPAGGTVFEVVPDPVLEGVVVVTVTDSAAPYVTAHPSGVTVIEGQLFTLTVAGAGAPTPSIQWESSSDGVTWAAIDGATSATLTLTATETKLLRAVLSNPSGSAASNAATISVIEAVAPVVTLDPIDVTVDYEDPFTMTAAASGVPFPSVQWQVSSDGGSTWSNVSGVDVDTITEPDEIGQTVVTFTGTAVADRRYRAVFTNLEGVATSAVAVLTVDLPPVPVITEDPAPYTSVPGDLVTLTAAATNYVSVRWQVSTNGTSWADVSGATSTSYAFYPFIGVRYYRAVFTNAAGSVATSVAQVVGVSD